MEDLGGYCRHVHHFGGPWIAEFDLGILHAVYVLQPFDLFPWPGNLHSLKHHKFLGVLRASVYFTSVGGGKKRGRGRERQGEERDIGNLGNVFFSTHIIRSPYLFPYNISTYQGDMDKNSQLSKLLEGHLGETKLTSGA